MFIDPALTPRFHAALRRHTDKFSPATLSRLLSGQYTEAMAKLFDNPELAQAWAADAQAAQPQTDGDAGE